MNEPKRILIFELNWLGDILFSFPFLRAIRKRFPEAYIACVVVPRYVALLLNNPWINDVHSLADSNNVGSVGEKLAFIRMIKKEKYDTCFFLKPSRTKAIMAVMAGISRRIGFSGKNSPLTEDVEFPSKRDMHRADQILSLAGAVGITEADGTYEYFVSDEDRERAHNVIHDSGGGIRRRVALNPGGNWDAKRWPPENFMALAKRLVSSFEDIEVAVTGAKKDMELARDIVAASGSPRCYSVAGKTGLNELAVLFEKSALVISSDTGPLHLASASGVTTIGLFGPTSHNITGPRGRGKNIVISKPVECEVPCYVDMCEKDRYCMRSITVDEVFDAAAEVL